MIESILLQKTEEIRAQLASRQAEQVVYEQANFKVMNELHSQYDVYQEECRKTNDRLQAEAKQLEVRVNSLKGKLLPHLEGLISFMQTHHLYPNLEYDFSTSPRYDSTPAEKFPAQLFDLGITWDSIPTNIEKLITDWRITYEGSYSSVPTNQEKIDKINEIVQSLSTYHPYRKFGVQWGMDDSKTRFTSYGGDSELGVSLYGIVVRVSYPDQITINDSVLDIQQIESDEAICEEITTAFLSRPASLGFLKLEEIRKKEFDQENAMLVSRFDPFYQTAWIQLSKYCMDSSIERVEQKASEAWFMDNLDQMQGESLEKFVELARSRGYEDTLVKLIHQLPVHRYFLVIDRFYPGQDHLNTAIDLFVKELQSDPNSARFLKYSPGEWEYIHRVYETLKVIGQLMVELNQRRLLTIDQFCTFIDAVNEGVRRHENNILSGDPAISRLFADWLSRVEDVEALDRIVSAWKLAQPNLIGRDLRLRLIQAQHAKERTWIRNAMICAGGTEAILAIMAG